MQAAEKTKEELATEVALLRQRVAELEASERERKQVEEALRESEQTKSAVLNATPDLVVVVDNDLIIRDVNKSFAKRFGKHPEELIGISGLDLVPTELRKDRERYCRMVLQTRQLVRFEDESRGTHFDNILYPILQEQGKVTRIVLNARDITERKQAEEDRLATLRFLESMDQVNRVMQGTNDLEQMMSDVLDEVLSMFDCDRAWFVYPCDPEATTWRAPMERTRPEYPGALILKLEMPIDSQVVRVFKAVLASDDPVGFGPGNEQPLPADVAKKFNEQSQLAMAVYPKVDKPYMFGIHQCSRPRMWTLEERRLLKEIGTRLADSLTSLLMYHDLKENEERFRSLFEGAPDAILLTDPESGRILGANPAASHLLSRPEEEIVGLHHSQLHPSHIKEQIEKAFIEDIQQFKVGKEPSPIESAVMRPDGSEVPVEILGHMVSIHGKPVLQGTFRDITERKQAEEALRESEECYRELADSIADVFFAMDKDLRYTYWNKASENLTGVEAKDAIGKTLYEIFPEVKGTIVEELYQEVLKTQQQKSIVQEYRLGEKSFVFEISVYPLMDGLSVFVKDITKHRQAEEALRESEEKFRSMFELLPYAAVLLDLEGNIQACNQQFVRLHATREGAEAQIGRNISDFFPREDKSILFAAIEKTIKEKKSVIGPVEYTMLRENGNRFPADGFSIVMEDETGLPQAVLGLAYDITERKQAEEALRESEEKYRSLVESSEDSIYLVDQKCNYIFLNNRHLSRLGVKMRQVIDRPYAEFHSSEESKDFRQKVKAVLKTGKSQSYEYRSQRDNRYFIRTLSPVTSSDGGEINAITVISKDITDRKQAEEKLGEREAFNYALFRYNPVETIVVDREGKVTAFNLAKEKSGDRLPIIGDRMYKDYAGKHEIDMSVELMKCITSGKRKGFPERKYGDKYLNITISPFAQGAIIISEDITERKRAEEALRESEQFSSNLLNNSPHPIIVITPDTSIRYVNPALEKLTGFSAAELLGRKAPYPWWRDEIVSETIRGLERAVQQGAQRIENHFQTKSGSQFWVEITSEPVMHDGKVQYLLSNWIDITERKRAEELLQKERDTFYTILEQAPYGVMVLDAAGNHSFLNPEFTSITGYTFEDVPTTQDWLHRAYPEQHYRNMVIKTWEDYYAQSKDEETFRKRFGRAFAMTLNVMCKDGANKEIEFRSSRLGDEATIVMLSDVTDRKRMNDLLETAAAEWRTTFDAISDAVCLLDSHGKIIRCNNAMLKLMGKPFSQITNHHCWEVMHAVSEAPHGCPIELVGKTNHRENEVMFKDSRWFNISVDPLLDEDGNFIGGVHIMSDITDRMHIQNELQDSREQLRNLTVYLQSVREQERTNIAREIHDELAQALTALKMDVSWLDHRMPADAQSLSEKAQSMAKLIDSTIHTVKRISAELRPGILDDLGLVAAIEWQAEEFQNRTGISCNVTVDPQDLTVEQDRSTAIFRIFQETLTNVTRHARATRVTVSLKERAGRLTLRVRDNGTGITEGKITHPQSFGLIGIRERVYPWGGKVSIKGIPGKGTTVQVSVELVRSKNDKEKIESIGSPS